MVYICLRPSAAIFSAVTSAVMKSEQPDAVYWGGLAGYRVFRIPVLTRAGRQLLAFAEARPTLRDHGRIDIVLRRSTDAGSTWGPVERVFNADDISMTDATVGNPVPIYLSRSRELILVFCSNAGRSSERAIRRGSVSREASRRVWMSRSLTMGSNWSAPIELTAAVKQPGWTWYATGPGGGIRMRNGTLVIPATHAAQATRKQPGGWDHSHVLLSDDDGASWHVGGSAAPGTNEATVAQLADGSLLLNARNLLKSTGGRRVLQASADGGHSWSAPWADEHLREPVNPPLMPAGCHGSMLATRRGARVWYTGLGTDGRQRLNLTLHGSSDSGHTWPYMQLLHHGPSGYSSLSRLPANRFAPVTIGVLYESGSAREHYAKRILFRKLDVSQWPSQH